MGKVKLIQENPVWPNIHADIRGLSAMGIIDVASSDHEYTNSFPNTANATWPILSVIPSNFIIDFPLSFLDIQDLFAERNEASLSLTKPSTKGTINSLRITLRISATHEMGDSWLFDQMFQKINEKRLYLWR